jgi:hypothetical protein
MDYLGNEAVYNLLINLTKEETLHFLHITEKKPRSLLRQRPTYPLPPPSPPEND